MPSKETLLVSRRCLHPIVKVLRRRRNPRRLSPFETVVAVLVSLVLVPTLFRFVIRQRLLAGGESISILPFPLVSSGSLLSWRILLRIFGRSLRSLETVGVPFSRLEQAILLSL